MIRKGCDAYLAHVVDTTTNTGKLEDIPVVREFSDVFPEELSGVSPYRDTKFHIELTPGITPISNFFILNGTGKIEGTKEATDRVIGKRLYPPKCFSLGCASIAC